MILLIGHSAVQTAQEEPVPGPEPALKLNMSVTERARRLRSVIQNVGTWHIWAQQRRTVLLLEQWLQGLLMETVTEHTGGKELAKLTPGIRDV